MASLLPFLGIVKEKENNIEEYVNLDKNITSVDLRGYKNLKSFWIDPECQIKELFVELYIWLSIKDMKQFENLEQLTITNFQDYRNLGTLDFSIYHNLIKLNINILYDDEILLTNMNLEELILDEDIYQQVSDLSTCVNLKKLSITTGDNIDIKLNNPSIEILNISGFYDNINISELVNLKEIDFSGLEGPEPIDLSNQKKLTKLVAQRALCRFINLNDTIEYIDVEAYEEHGEWCEIFDSDEINNLINLKHLSIENFKIKKLNVSKLTKLEYLLYYGWEEIEGINKNTKYINIGYIDDYPY